MAAKIFGMHCQTNMFLKGPIQSAENHKIFDAIPFIFFGLMFNRSKLESLRDVTVSRIGDTLFYGCPQTVLAVLMRRLIRQRRHKNCLMCGWYKSLHAFVKIYLFFKCSCTKTIHKSHMSS